MTALAQIGALLVGVARRSAGAGGARPTLQHLKNSALAHLPSGVFTANAAWLVLAVIAFNLTRGAATLTSSDLAKATTATVRRKLVAIPARVATTARRVVIHLPRAWPWETAWTQLFNRATSPPITIPA